MAADPPPPTMLQAEVADRFGVLPNFFCTAAAAPGLIDELWGFAKSAYLDLPLPPLFKERLFVQLSRFCEVRYCIVRHVGFLVGLGRPAGDADAPPESVDEVIALLRRPMPEAGQLAGVFDRLRRGDHAAPLPASGTQAEADLFDALTIIFVEPTRSASARDAVRAAFGDATFELLAAYLAFVRTAHFWTETHPELAYEPDMLALMEQRPDLREMLLTPSDAERVRGGGDLRHILAELQETEAALRESEARYRAFVNASADVVYRMSPDWSQMRELDGRGFIADTTAPSEDWRDRYILPDDRAMVQSAIDAAIAARGLFALEHRVIRPDGSIGWTSSRAIPILDGSGAIVEWIGTASDVTEQRRAARAFRESETRNRLLIQSWAQAEWETDAAGVVVADSPSWRAYTGQTVEEWLGYGWLNAVHPDDRASAERQWQEAVAARDLVNAEFRLCAPDGRWHWTNVRAAPVFDGTGKIEKWVGINVDIDPQKRIEEALQGSEQRLRVLVAELQHRVRNILTVIRLTFARTFATEGSKEELADHFTGRLDAMARTQVALTRRADRTANLEDLIRDELLSVGVGADGGVVTLAGPEIDLDHKTTESLAMALHELTTNALKYGALNVRGATLSISWKLDPREGNATALCLDWVEQGVPAIAVQPARRGFGRELIEEALPYRLGAETILNFGGGGLRCSIRVPLGAEEPIAAL